MVPDEAREGLSEGGISIESVLVCGGRIIGRGHNQRVRKGSVIHDGEVNCLENAGATERERLPAMHDLHHAFTCSMCTGALFLYQILRVVIEENVTFKGAENSLRTGGSRWRYSKMKNAFGCASSSPNIRSSGTRISGCSRFA